MNITSALCPYLNGLATIRDKRYLNTQ